MLFFRSVYALFAAHTFFHHTIVVVSMNCASFFFRSVYALFLQRVRSFRSVYALCRNVYALSFSYSSHSLRSWSLIPFTGDSGDKNPCSTTGVTLHSHVKYKKI